MKLVSDDELERSAVAANCRMNRERNLTGSNGYSRELGFDPLAFLRERTSPARPVAWLDLCCGTGQALIEASRIAGAEGTPIAIVGVDLVGIFHRRDPDSQHLRLVEASLSTWSPEGHLDLITCVHGLHYIGDKLRLIARAASWLADDGLFVANIDLGNLRFAGGRPAGRRIVSDLRRAGVGYNPRKRLIACRGRKALSLPYRYLGADDGAGPNYTAQPAVDSYYQPTAVDLTH
jgi:SAM-dependent methyltransferase